MTNFTEKQLREALRNGAQLVGQYPAQRPLDSRSKQDRAHKYNAQPVTVDGHRFDSKAEMRRYLALRLLVADGQIDALELQPRFVLLEGFTDNTGKRQRPIVYVADFAYTDGNGRRVVEDVKGVETAVFRMKKKLFLARYPEFILEIVR